MNASNIYNNTPDELPDELIEIIVKSENIRIERIVSPMGHQTPEGKWFNQDRDEFVILLQGSAEVLFRENNKSMKLIPGDYIIIPKHKQHRVESTDTNIETIWLVAHYK